MAKWTVEQFKDELQKTLGPGLISLVLYGSQAAGDHLGEASDTNLLALVDRLDLDRLKALSGPVAAWAKQGNPPPLFLTPGHLRRYVDLFPLEISDIQENHRVLAGTDPFEGLVNGRTALRQQLEHEFQGKLLRLRTRFLLTRGREGELRKLLAGSLSSFLVLLKNALWLYGEKPPVKKLEAVKRLGERLGLPTTVFGTVELLKRGERIPKLSLETLFGEYLRVLESFQDKIHG
ncbi:MAG TPA: hypothetical protein VFR02_08760 [bacterium]|nr:hypothetical protein [bacterium]